MARKRRTLSGWAADTWDALEVRLSPSHYARRKLAENAVRLQEQMIARDAARHEHTKGKNWLVGRSSPDTELEAEHEDARNRSRDLYLNDPIGASYVKGRVTNVIGTGMSPQSQIRGDDVGSSERAEKLNRQLEELAKRQAKKADVSGLRALWMQQRLVQRCVDRDGEAFVVFSARVVAKKPLPLAVEVVSVQRVETPPNKEGDLTVRLGRKRDKDGVVTHYYIRRTEPNDSKEWDETYDEVPAERVCHIYEEEEPNQSRGWPGNTPSQRTLINAKDFEEAVIIGKQVQACLTVHIPKANPLATALGAATSTQSDGKRLQQISPGLINYYDPVDGTPITTTDPSKGGEDHATYMDSLTRKAAAGCNYPAEMLSKGYGSMNFASTRASIIEGRVEFDAWQQFQVDLWLSRWWEEFVREAVIAGLVDISPAEYNERPHVFERNLWVPCQRDWVDPLKDVSANVKAVETNVRSKSMVASSAGSNFDDVMEQRTRERILEAEADFAVKARESELEKELLELRQKLELPGPAEETETGAAA